MSVLNSSKKTAQHDWHRADILAALRKNGWSLRSLAKAGNVSYNTLKSALDKPYPKMERLIANAVGVAPEQIWAARALERIERNRKPVLTNKF
ncbi:helix-turn-helix domain-containing protein [Aggregatibacter actinomycetemcomitans]|uniref:helix-turn-helix domain-containing protein n=1 Tax=Aggregatibacter actinomycetemcomitans TaxID=714 RepID=UPI00022AC10F|nr:helix-turn-helix domain-containing protein [Aggregatibacter actinomycetemcomitans]KND83863.1 DNA-binding protein [Aggregatibacter actinomycetemcomitans serotype b str. SCC1398]KOE51649.1 DNA-binding protein [Aggregatibacter actinomycetemcomitans serotype b str. SCC4092]QEH47527.1 DNA-binding protein [Aggregatibacter actinomycetemcomitans]TYA16999.1 DNA-binding protein [Aggregatibacter actinomycetemcomitans]TYA33775.1 DNA-binding protein [Aggregatibacter actinomycetemcomitans]